MILFFILFIYNKTSSCTMKMAPNFKKQTRKCSHTHAKQKLSFFLLFFCQGQNRPQTFPLDNIRIVDMSRKLLIPEYVINIFWICNSWHNTNISYPLHLCSLFYSYWWTPSKWQSGNLPIKSISTEHSSPDVKYHGTSGTHS